MLLRLGTFLDLGFSFRTEHMERALGAGEPRHQEPLDSRQERSKPLDSGIQGLCTCI